MKMKRILMLCALAASFTIACGSPSKEKPAGDGPRDDDWGDIFGEGGEEEDPVTGGRSTLKLPYVISSGMVLQQQSDVCIWGKATPGAVVSVLPSWAQKAVSTTVPADGIWQLSVRTPAASFNAVNLKISDSQGGSKTIGDVLIGEVWMTVGQSNMEQCMRGFGTVGADNYQPILNFEAELQDADIPSFRYFKDKYQLSDSPQFDTKESSWTKSSPTNSLEFQAIAYFFGRKLGRDLNVPVGIIGCAYGGSRIEAWMSKASLNKFPASDWKDAADLGLAAGATDKQAPAQIYNGMVLPVIKYSVRGILWYQGESNRDNSSAYPALQAEMVRDWRSLKGDSQNTVPFYCVQLASNHTSDENAWAVMQAAQLEGTVLIPNSGIIPAYDCGGPTIHYPDKKTPGERLALLAEDKCYNLQGKNSDAPRFVSKSVSGNRLTVTLSNADGLHLGEGQEKILYGKVAGSDGVFKDAEVEISGSSLIFSSTSVSEPVSVSLCYGAWCVGGTVYNAAGLPVFPFKK